MTETTILELFKKITEYLSVNKEHTLQGMLTALEWCIPVKYDNFIKFNTESYQRTLIYQNQVVDAYLLTWLPGQGTRFHRHPIRGCIYRVLQGQLREDRIIEGVIHSSVLKKGECAYIDDTVGIHKVINSGEVPAISLHFYAPPGYYQDTTPLISGTNIEPNHQKQDSDCQDKNQDKDSSGDKDVRV
jgi:hypothetical protein